MVTLNVSTLDYFGEVSQNKFPPKRKEKTTIQNLTQGTKTLQLSYGRGYLVTYLLIFDMETLKVSNLDKFREIFSKYLAPQKNKKKCHHTEFNSGHQDASFEL